MAPSAIWTRARQRGFSASEMLVAVAIIGMMVLISTPSLITFWNSMKARTGAHRLMSHIRLCRQIAVSRRTPVLMELQRTEGTTRPTYKAWEERSTTLPNAIVRNPSGADGSPNTPDDEAWVVRAENQLGIEKVKFVDSYADSTPSDPADALGASIMDGTGKMYLKFYPNGEVRRIDAADNSPEDDPSIRIRLRRKVTGSRVDQWDVTLNRVGKVGTDFLRVPPPE